MTTLALLALTCVLLGAYVAWLLRDLSKKAAHQKQVEEGRQQRIENHRRDLGILLRCLDEQQVELSEACLRVKLTLNAIQSLGATTPDHEVFERMYLELENHPVGEARNRLQKQERRQWDLKRWEIEGRYRDSLMEEGRQLMQWLQAASLAKNVGETAV